MAGMSCSWRLRRCDIPLGSLEWILARAYRCMFLGSMALSIWLMVVPRSVTIGHRSFLFRTYHDDNSFWVSMPIQCACGERTARPWRHLHWPACRPILKPAHRQSPQLEGGGSQAAGQPTEAQTCNSPRWSETLIGVSQSFFVARRSDVRSWTGVSQLYPRPLSGSCSMWRREVADENGQRGWGFGEFGRLMLV